MLISMRVCASAMERQVLLGLAALSHLEDDKAEFVPLLNVR